MKQSPNPGHFTVTRGNNVSQAVGATSCEGFLVIVFIEGTHFSLDFLLLVTLQVLMSNFSCFSFWVVNSVIIYGRKSWMFEKPEYR